MMRLLVLVLVAGCAAPPSPEPEGGACPLALVVGTVADPSLPTQVSVLLYMCAYVYVVAP